VGGGSGTIILLSVACHLWSTSGSVARRCVFANALVDVLAGRARVVSQKWELVKDERIGLGLATFDMLQQVVDGDVLGVSCVGVALSSGRKGAERTLMVGTGQGERRRPWDGGGRDWGLLLIGIVVGVVVVAAVVGIGEFGNVGDAVPEGVVAWDERLGWWREWWQSRPCKNIIRA
jgi:hypothetical protein